MQIRTNSKQAAGGFSLIEVVVALAVASVAVLGFSRAILGAVVLNQTNQESGRASRAARQVLAEIQAAPFSEAFARYNATAADDLADGEHLLGAFAVDGLQALADDPDGLVGEILFPTDVSFAGTLELREDLDLPVLGMPRDLNLDGLVDASDHKDDYQLLPVLVRVSWRGRAGPARAEFKTLLIAP